MLTCILWCASPQVFGRGREKTFPGYLVQNSLKHDFPGVAQVSWAHERDGSYTASFAVARGRVLATYDSDGNLELTRVFSDASHMPFATKMVIEEKYPDYQPQHMTECIGSAAHCYYFLLKKQEHHLVTWLRIRISADGRTSVIQQLHQKVA